MNIDSMRGPARILASIAVFLVGSDLAGGQGRVDEEIVVTSTKLEKRISDLTQSVTIIDEEQIKLNAYTDFTEVLRETAGIEFRQVGGPGQFNHPKMRGFATSAILVVLDGVKINEASSGGVGHLIGQIAPSSIERVEILRGPQAVLYGANSTAGVISITTKSGHTRDGSLDVEAGSLDWRRGALSIRNTVAAADGDLAYSLNVSKLDSGNVHPLEYTRTRRYKANSNTTGIPSVLASTSGRPTTSFSPRSWTRRTAVRREEPIGRSRRRTPISSAAPGIPSSAHIFVTISPVG